MKRCSATGVRIAALGLVQLGLQPRDKRVLRLLIGTWAASRRHDPRSQFSNDTFPLSRMCSHVTDVERIEGNIRRPQLSDESRRGSIGISRTAERPVDEPVVVAGDTIPIDHLLV